MIKGFLFLMIGIVALMSVVGGYESTPDLTIFQVVQLFVVALCGFGSMLLGVSFLKDGE